MRLLQTPPPVGQFEYYAEIFDNGCTLVAEAWLTSPLAIVAGTIMRANVTNDLTGDTNLECVTIGQQQARPQGGDYGTIIGSITYPDCASC